MCALQQFCDLVTVSQKKKNSAEKQPLTMQRLVFTDVCSCCRWLGESRKTSLINAPRVSIVINGDEKEEQIKSGRYCVSAR